LGVGQLFAVASGSGGGTDQLKGLGLMFFDALGASLRERPGRETGASMTARQAPFRIV
jgi:hypothetical protein